MPTYEYRCQTCGHLFEQFQSITAKPLKACPKCDGTVDPLIGAGGAIITKGGSRGPALPCGSQGPCCGADSPCMRGLCDV